MFCPKCGAKIDDNLSCCSDLDENLKNNNKKSKHTKIHPVIKFLAAFAAVLITAGVFVALWLCPNINPSYEPTLTERLLSKGTGDWFYMIPSWVSLNSERGENLNFREDGSGFCEFVDDNDGFTSTGFEWSIDDKNTLTIKTDDTYVYSWVDSSLMENNWANYSSTDWSLSDNYLYIGKIVFPCKVYDSVGSLLYHY